MLGQVMHQQAYLSYSSDYDRWLKQVNEIWVTMIGHDDLPDYDPRVNHSEGLSPHEYVDMIIEEEDGKI